MKKILQNIRVHRLVVSVAVTLAVFFTVVPSSYAQPAWDLTGNWCVWFEVQDGYYQESLDITSENYSTSSFVGIVNGSYQVDGSISGSTFQWGDPYVGGDGGGFYGSIATNGTMVGNYMTASGPGGVWYGFWGECGGIAVQYAAPTFTLEPVSQIITAGQAVTFTSSATGHPAPVYQWQFNGSNIPDATNSSYTISPTSITNLGIYDVVASNEVGTNTSTNASLSFLNMQCFPGLVLYGPVGAAYAVQSSPSLSGTNWTTITNVTLTSAQPYIFVDYTVITNQALFYRTVPITP
jgi:hypothetical protein